MQTNKIVCVLILFLLIAVAPYMVAAFAAGDSHVFSGFLFNPIDGNSYLAKMYQGWQGSWTYHLPYTADPGEGTYIYLFYLFLGHISRWLGLDRILVYHAARVLGGIFLFFSLYRFLKKYSSNEDQSYFIKLIVLCLFGSGLGWLFFLFIGKTADFWVAEVYPLLSTLTNAHFPLTLALMLNGLLLFDEPDMLGNGIKLFAIGFALALLSPFGLAVVLFVMSIQAVWIFIDLRTIKWQPIAWMGIGGGPYFVYLLWVYRTHPQISVWQRQNINFSPGILDLLISLSPAFLLAFLGCYFLWKRQNHPGRKLWLSWFIAGGLMVIVPFSLQRRLLLGYYIPCSILGIMGLVDWLKNSPKGLNRFYFAVIVLSLPTTIILLATVFYGIQTKDGMYYLSSSEARAMKWIEQNTAQDAIILSSPVMGMYIPAQTGRRVIYGHPFETVNAEEMLGMVENLYNNTIAGDMREKLIAENHVAYIFYGPRESVYGELSYLQKYPVVYEDSDILIYSTGIANP